MILFWSIFWRGTILQIGFAAVFLTLASFPSITLTTDVIFIKRSLYFLLMALLLISTLYFYKKGAFSIIWGKRLNFSAQDWRKMTWVFSVIYIIQSILNLIVAYSFDTEFWLSFQSIAPPIGTLAGSIIIAKSIDSTPPA
jgi:intracellular septation protein A